MIGGKGESDTLFCFSAFPTFMLHTEQARSRTPGAGSSGSGVAHQARRAGEGLAHAHALLLVDAECVGLDGQLVLQPALGHYQQLQRVLCLPQSQLEGLQGVVDGEHLVHEPVARAEEKAQFTERSALTYLLGARSWARHWRLLGAGQTRLREQGGQRKNRQTGSG